MNKIYKYIFYLTSKYILINILLVTILVMFINLLEISRLVDDNNSNTGTFVILSIFKIPTIISETIPFVIVMCIGLAIVMIFPEIATWLPEYVSKR